MFGAKVAAHLSGSVALENYLNADDCTSYGNAAILLVVRYSRRTVFKTLAG